MTREKAIEAAGDALRDWKCTCRRRGYRVLLCDGCGKVVNETDEATRLGGEVVEAAAPFIESALLDRIERKVRLQGLVDPDSTDAWSNGWEAALDAVLAVLSQIREEGER